MEPTGSLRHPFPYLLLPTLWSAANRARRRDRGDTLRTVLFSGIGLGVAASLFGVFFWLTLQVGNYDELGAYLVRMGLSWLFLTFLSFVAFSSLVASLSTFFLSEDLRLLIATPIPGDRLFYSRFVRTVAQSSWMVVTFLAPVLLGVGWARCAPWFYYCAVPLTILPFVVIPSAAGSLVTLFLVNVFPARRARDILVLTGLLFAVGLIVLLRMVRPERLLAVESLPDIAAFFSTLQSPVTPLLPSFWAGEALFSALTGGVDHLYLGSLWTTAIASTLLARMAFGRYYFAGWSKAQEARKARFRHLRLLDRGLGLLPARLSTRSLLAKDLKVFLRDTTQWSQLLLIVALALVYVYNFGILDIDRIPYVSGLVKDAYAFVNLTMAAFVLSAVAVRFVFPAVSVEGAAFWVIRTAPIPMRAFLWSKFWTGLLPTLLLSETLAILSNEYLKTTLFLKVVVPVAIFAMSFSLVGLAAGLGARYPRFSAENVTQVSGSYGGIVFMVVAVLFILAEIVLIGGPCFAYLWSQHRHVPLESAQKVWMSLSVAGAAVLSVVTFWVPMRQGVRALEALRD